MYFSIGSLYSAIMDLPCDSFFQKCDDMMAALFDDDDSGLGMDFDFRNVSDYHTNIACSQDSKTPT